MSQNASLHVLVSKFQSSMELGQQSELLSLQSSAAKALSGAQSTHQQTIVKKITQWQGFNFFSIYCSFKQREQNDIIPLISNQLFTRHGQMFTICSYLCHSASHRGGCSSGGRADCLVIGRSGSLLLAACRSVLEQDTEPQIAPDVGTLHGSLSHQCMNVCVNGWILQVL